MFSCAAELFVNRDLSGDEDDSVIEWDKIDAAMMTKNEIPTFRKLREALYPVDISTIFSRRRQGP